jgi:hypothetical protein
MFLFVLIDFLDGVWEGKYGEFLKPSPVSSSLNGSGMSTAHLNTNYIRGSRVCLLDAASVYHAFDAFRSLVLRGSELYSPYLF